jgi:hypothetical protein
MMAYSSTQTQSEQSSSPSLKGNPEDAIRPALNCDAKVGPALTGLRTSQPFLLTQIK